MLDGAQLSELMAHAWPGNVRELRNVADRFVLGLLPEDFGLQHGHRHAGSSLPEQLEQFERAVITDELRRQHGEVAATAKVALDPEADPVRQASSTTHRQRRTSDRKSDSGCRRGMRWVQRTRR